MQVRLSSEYQCHGEDGGGGDRGDVTLEKRHDAGVWSGRVLRADERDICRVGGGSRDRRKDSRHHSRSTDNEAHHIVQPL